MSMQGAPTPAGWYPDPQSPGQGRYWDGAAWTDLRHTPGQPYPALPPLQAPAGTDWNTVWIWLVILLPLLPSLLLLGVPWGSMYDIDVTASNAYEGTRGMFDVMFSPFYWAAVILGYVVYGLTVFFAFRDYKELAGRGVPKPFHWAFAFIGGVVYAIGRSVVVKRRTGRGHATLWAEIAVLVITFGIAFTIVGIMLASMFSLFESIPGYR